MKLKVVEIFWKMLKSNHWNCHDKSQKTSLRVCFVILDLAPLHDQVVWLMLAWLHRGVDATKECLMSSIDASSSPSSHCWRSKNLHRAAEARSSRFWPLLGNLQGNVWCQAVLPNAGIESLRPSICAVSLAGPRSVRHYYLLMHGKLTSPHNARTDHTVLGSNLKIHQVWWYDWELHAEGHAMARYSSRHWPQWPRTVTAFCIVILLRIAKFRLERVSSSVGFNCPQSARSDSWQWLAAKQHRHFTPCLSLTSFDHHIYKSYMHMGSCWQSQVSARQHVVFLLFACPRAMYPAEDLILLTHSLKCLISSMVASSITEGCLLASHIRTAVNTLMIW